MSDHQKRTRRQIVLTAPDGATVVFKKDLRQTDDETRELSRARDWAYRMYDATTAATVRTEDA